MRQVVAAAAVLFLVAQPAAAAKVTWRGNICITAISASCVPGDFEVGCLTMAYRPPNIGDNGPQTLFAFGNEKWRYGAKLSSGTLYGATYKAVALSAITVGAFSPSGVTLRFTSQSPLPANLTAASPTVYMAGNINNMDGVANCNLSFRASGVRAP